MRARPVGRPSLSDRERQTLLEATHRFVASVEAQSGARAAELAKELLHDGKCGKSDELSDSELARDWSVLRATMKHARWLSRQRLLQAMETAARLYGWIDDEDVMALLECNREYIDRLDASARQHDEEVQRAAVEHWESLTRHLMDRYNWTNQTFVNRLAPIRVKLMADEAVASADARAKAQELLPARGDGVIPE